VAAVAAGHDRLSDADPPAARSQSASAGPLVDIEALRKAVTGR
jgi:hypothetical protein